VLVFGGGWCWFLVRINGDFFFCGDGGAGFCGGACGGYVFCGFSLLRCC